MTTTTQRGYGAQHQRERAAWESEINDGARPTCHHCGNPIEPWDSWHLDHTPDRSAYRGPAHAHCNTSDGAKRGNAARAQPRRLTL